MNCYSECLSTFFCCWATRSCRQTRGKFFGLIQLKRFWRMRIVDKRALSSAAQNSLFFIFKGVTYAHDISLNYNYLDPATEWYHVLRMRNWTEANVTVNYVKYRYFHVLDKMLSLWLHVCRIKSKIKFQPTTHTEMTNSNLENYLFKECSGIKADFKGGKV